MRDQLPRYWPTQKAYHHAWRASTVESSLIAVYHLPREFSTAACGDAFYSDLLSAVVGPQARIVAADSNLATLGSRPVSSTGVQRCLTDVERAGLRLGSFDVVWMCRSMHSATDPQRRVTALAASLRPGRLIVIENDPFHCSIPAWPSDFERRVQRALDRRLQQRCGNGHRSVGTMRLATCPDWLGTPAGLCQITVLTYPVEDVVPLADDVERYWQLWMNLRGEMIWPFLSSADRRAYSRAFDPDSREYVLRKPGCVVMIRRRSCAVSPNDDTSCLDRSTGLGKEQLGSRQRRSLAGLRRWF